MDTLIKRVRGTIEKYGMLGDGDRVLVAVSGGPDSVFLLYSLGELTPRYNLSLHVAHLDHRLRGEESKEDAKWVAALADRMGIPSTVESFDLPSYLEAMGVSTEEGGRRVRYEFLERIGSEIGADRIALGHTANDQAETLLLRLIRGAGTLGLSSIPPKRGKVSRPLIEIAKEEILEWLNSRNTAYRIDSTNLTLSCRRNVIRRVILPELARLNPGVVGTLRRTAEILREEEDFLASEVKKVLLKVVRRRKGQKIVLDLDGLLDYNISLRRRILREVVQNLKGDLLRISFKDVDALLQLCQFGRTGSRVDLPSLVAEKGYGELILREGEPEEAEHFEKKVQIPGITTVDSTLQIGCEVISSSDLSEGLDFENRAYFDLALLTPPLMVRSRRRGDRFIPFGMEGSSKSLKDLFIEEKIPRRLRPRVPVLADGQGILWIIGHRRSDRAKVGPSTGEVLVVERL